MHQYRRDSNPVPPADRGENALRRYTIGSVLWKALIPIHGCVKDAQWLLLYTESIYETFSRMSRCAREEERQLVWNRLKEIMYELTLASKHAWKDKNDPDRLSVYVSFAKLCKSYLDVADEESFKMCDTMAKEAKFVGKGTLGDDQWKEANCAIDQIKKIISDALHERELLDDSD
ncbi:unnamed protein product [Heligmosomoides polygyrus]|uniref:14-3-3 protein n=1 Tax=Heligmosomoides polygyrus TaxID=6339 RepID=A0A183G1H8_HELPZ|nr:unnamed protein product [Heligmosomoides polygyrus]